MAQPASVPPLRAPLVGRGRELEELEAAFERAVSTRTPQAVTLFGSPGVGKSRLVDEFLEMVEARSTDARVLRGVCRENGPAFAVVRQILRSRFELPENAEAKDADARLRKELAEVLGDERVADLAHFVGRFLDLRLSDSPLSKAFDDDPGQVARVGQAVLRRFFEADAAQAPIVLTFEDLHWAQDDSLGLVEYLFETLRDAPILLVAVSRPDLIQRRASWTRNAPNHLAVELAPLGTEDAAELVAKLLSPLEEPPQALVDAAVEVANGSPYLLEQMVRTFFTSRTLTVDENGAWQVDLERLEDAQLPMTFDDAIRARISSLAPTERELLEKASAMGGVFWVGALIALSRLDKTTPELWGGQESLVAHYQDALASLAARDFVMELPDSSIPGQQEFAFKHNPERETLHRLADSARMRRYHLVVAEWLDVHLEERGEAQLEMLAQHYEEGGATTRSASFWLAAGDRARDRYAHAKAAQYYERGLSLMNEADVVAQLDALHHYGDVLQHDGRYEDALRTFGRMRALAYRLDLKAKGGVAHNRIGRVYRTIGRLDEAMRHLGTGLALFDAIQDRRGVASSYDDIGKVHWMRGTYEAADQFLRQALEMRRSFWDPRSVALSCNNLALVCQERGEFAEALALFQEALSLRRSIGDRPGIAQTLNNLGTVHQDDGDHPRARELYREALEIAQTVGDRMRQAVILTNLGESSYRMEQPEEAIRVLQQAEEIGRSLGDRILEGEILRGLAKAHMLIKDFERARDYVERSVALFEEAKGKPFLGVALRTQGEIAACAGWVGEDHDRAKDAFLRSIRLFEELGNQPELAHSCEAFATFLVAHPERARDPLVIREATLLRDRAEEIRSRLRASEEFAPEPPTNKMRKPEEMLPSA